MSKVKMNPVFEGFSRRMGNLVFYKRGGVVIARINAPQKNPNSPAQKVSRGAFAFLSTFWKNAHPLLRAGWSKHAEGKHYSGYNAFLKANIPRRRAGLPLVLIPATGEDHLLRLSARTGASPGEIIAEFTAPVGYEGSHLTIFAQENSDSMEYRPFTRYDFGEGYVPPVTIGGLEPGMSYHIYAVLTDAALDSAKEIYALSVAPTLSRGATQ